MSHRVAIVGSGAIGGYLAAELVEAGREVTLCVRTPFDKLVVEEPDRTREVEVALATEPAEVGPVPFVLLTTKSQDTAATKPWLDRLVGPDTTIVVVQNGLDHVERVQALAPSAKAILPAIIYCSVERVAPGRILHHTAAALSLPSDPEAASIAELFAPTSFKVTEEADFTSVAWRKLFANIVANPITSLTLRRIRVVQEADIQVLASGILAEALQVARAEGAKLTEADSEKVLRGLGKGKPDGGTSMLYDRLEGRPLEHEYITGAVVRAAERHGIDVPLNRAILALLRAASGRQLDGSS